MSVLLLFLPTLILYIFIPALLIFILVRFLKRKEARAIERLKVEKESLSIHKQQMTIINDLNKELYAIEKMLKDVE
ncbi:hypothetical protein CHH55_15780 [Niallia circulans]|jgi:uncharacterized membrane protein|uniref:Uncharacterized protein n=1 Tax=Niallia circulans TaxID=1397 RepID=A0A0J1LFS2_NIACI|nr:hypothetical protein [Niallia circulans]KLV27950.1 hypothetical protein ABW02_03385 [Niallia circulans]MCM2982993.1 hypothetical protein [Niallia circulans]MDR4314757.1 hypothetical protein [Niallia circulans]MED3841686.1 hypothetical protein [Niallia circulans]MED4242924.1 hypothetical protein [Niallia circulans]